MTEENKQTRKTPDRTPSEQWRPFINSAPRVRQWPHSVQPEPERKPSQPEHRK